jgi:hypothetical protein
MAIIDPSAEPEAAAMAGGLGEADGWLAADMDPTAALDDSAVGA